MTHEAEILTLVLSGFVLFIFTVWIFIKAHEDKERKWHADHEHKAVEREKDAKKRHEIEITMLTDARRLMLGAIADRNALSNRVQWLEEVVDNHGFHLEAVGRTGVLKKRSGP